MPRKQTIDEILNWTSAECQNSILLDVDGQFGVFRAAIEKPETVQANLLVLANKCLPPVIDAVLRSEPNTAVLRDLAIAMAQLVTRLGFQVSNTETLVHKCIALLNTNRAANHKLVFKLLPHFGQEASAAIPSLKQHIEKASIGSLAKRCIETIRNSSSPTSGRSSRSLETDDTTEFSQTGDDTQFSPLASQFVKSASRSIAAIPRKLDAEVSSFHSMLRKVEGLTFKKNPVARQEAYQLVTHVNAWAFALSHTLVFHEAPVFLVCAPPDSVDSNAIRILAWQDGEITKEVKAFPLLTSRSESEFAWSPIANETINRFEALEKLVAELALLSGHRSLDRPDALRIKDLINSLRRAARVSLWYTGPKAGKRPEKVSLVVSHTSFALRRSHDNETIYTSKIFPKIEILTKI